MNTPSTSSTPPDVTTQNTLLSLPAFPPTPASQAPTVRQESISKTQSVQVQAEMQQIRLEMHRMTLFLLTGFSVTTGLLFLLALLFGIFVGHLL